MFKQLVPNFPGFTGSLSIAALLCGVAIGSASEAVGQAPPAPASPSVSPLGGTYGTSQPITILDTTPGAVIYYLVNGATPIAYSTPVMVSGSETIQAVAIAIGGGTYSMSAVNAQTYTIQGGAPAWTQLTNLPSLMASQGGSLENVGDGNVYAMTSGGSAPNVVVSMFIAPQGNLANWIQIASPSLSQTGIGYPISMGMMQNGTILLTERNGAATSDVFFWNGSTSSPAWTLVGGWSGVTASSIYNFTNDSAGYTYFSPAWSGDIWRNDLPNSTNFSKVLSDMYGHTNGGDVGHPASGGIYQMHAWNLGSGDMLWAGGEGELDELNLGFTAWKSFLTTAQGFRGNFTSLANSPTTILAQRTDANGNSIVKINPTTLVQTTVSAASAGYPAYMDTNAVGGLTWIYGTKWLMNNDRNGTAFLLYSQDDGTTWTNIEASGGLGASCTGSNLSRGAIAVGHYIVARCQGGKSFWTYGPV